MRWAILFVVLLTPVESRAMTMKELNETEFWTVMGWGWNYRDLIACKDTKGAIKVFDLVFNYTADSFGSDDAQRVMSHFLESSAPHSGNYKPNCEHAQTIMRGQDGMIGWRKKARREASK